jgi:hypothetical protein
MPSSAELTLDHLGRLRDSTGLIQHAIYSVPRGESGYTTSAGGAQHDRYVDSLSFRPVLCRAVLDRSGTPQGLSRLHQTSPANSIAIHEDLASMVEGGYVCRNCGFEVDTAGTKVPAGTAPQQRSIITGIGLVALAVIPAIVLLTLIFRR